MENKMLKMSCSSGSHKNWHVEFFLTNFEQNSEAGDAVL